MTDDKPYIDTKIEASEARTNANFTKINSSINIFRAETNAKFDILIRKLDDVAANAINFCQMVGFTLSTIVAIVGILVAIMAYGGDSFNMGLSLSPTINDLRENNNKKFDKIDERFDKIDTDISEIKQLLKNIQK